MSEIKPGLSLVCAVYKDSENLRKLVLQLCSSPKGSWELIVVNGYPIEDLSPLIEPLGIDFKLIQESDEGLYDALNKGTRAAKYSHILVLGADDEIVDFTLLESASDIFISHNTLYITNLVIGYQSTDVIRYKNMSKINKSHLPICNGTHYHHQTCIMPKKFLELHPYSSAYSIHSDLEVMLTAQKFLKSKFLDNYCIKFNTGGVSTSLSNVFTSIREIIFIRKSGGYSIFCLNIYVGIIKSALRGVIEGLILKVFR